MMKLRALKSLTVAVAGALFGLSHMNVDRHRLGTLILSVEEEVDRGTA